MKEIEIKRNGKIAIAEIEEIRRSVGWNPDLGRYKKAMKNTYAHFTFRKKGKLMAFARIVSDGSIYAFIVDVNVRPEAQDKGLGKRFLREIIKELKKDGIQTVQLTFKSDDKKLESFYRNLGFNTKLFKAGDMDLNDYNLQG